MTGQLQRVDGGPPAARCIRCGATAVGPCARCHQPVCGDCCVLTEGGVRTWAICLACEDRHGRSLSGGWGGVIKLFLVPIGVLAVIVVLISLVDR